MGASVSTSGVTNTAYLDTPLSQLMVPSNLSYDELLERHGNGSGIPDSKHLDTLAADLRTLAQLAELRGQVCDKGMRYLSRRRKERLEEEREKERETRELEDRKEKMKREAAARDEEDEGRGSKGQKIRKRKDRSKVREERPLVHGAHGLARQDGLDTEMKGETTVLMRSFLGVATSWNCLLWFECRFLIVSGPSQSRDQGSHISRNCQGRKSFHQHLVAFTLVAATIANDRYWSGRCYL